MEKAGILERGLDSLGSSEGGFLRKAWNWLAGIDIKAADEEIEEAFDAAFKTEDREHSSEMARLDSVFKELEGIEDSAEKFSRWQKWWQDGAKEFQRHEEKMETLIEAKARIHLAAYVKSQPFFIRPLLSDAVERVSRGCRK